MPRWYGQQAIRTFMEHTMKTASGIRLTKDDFDSVPWLPANQTILETIKNSMTEE